ncbi:MAG: hypothetical protein IBX55_17185 [Methyloprofundus sp.]|nr:hypothetical protein [Methyloprofundus sp.]
MKIKLADPLPPPPPCSHESEIEMVIDQANIIILLSNKDLSEEDIDDIKEDKISRGGKP